MYSEMNLEIAIKYINGSISDMEKAEFDGWLNASEDNRIQFNDFQKYWKLTNSVFTDFQPNTNNAWKKVSEKTIMSNKNPFSYFYRIAIAAVVIMALGLGIKLYLQSDERYSKKIIANVSNDTIKEIKLEDGSVVWLNENSKLDVPSHFGKKQRKVRLQGEAYFEIAKNKQKPFIIETKSAITEVVGTSFNIRALENESKITVSVSTGKVAFYLLKERSSKVLLTPGMKGICNIETRKIETSPENDLNYLAWKTGVLQFKNTPLADVCNSISKFYNVRVIVDPSEAKDFLFTGNFNNTKVDQTLDIIATTLDIKFIKSESQIQVKFK